MHLCISSRNWIMVYLKWWHMYWLVAAIQLTVKTDPAVTYNVSSRTLKIFTHSFVCLSCSCGRQKVKTKTQKQLLATKFCHVMVGRCVHLVSWTALDYDCYLISSYIARRRPFLYLDGASCEHVWCCGWCQQAATLGTVCSVTGRTSCCHLHKLFLWQLLMDSSCWLIHWL